MKKTTALWTLSLLVSLSSGATAAEHANRSRRSVDLIACGPHGGATPGGESAAMEESG